jgi:carbonic anhydrase
MAIEHLPSQSPIDLGYALPIEYQLPYDAVTLQWDNSGSGSKIETEHGPEITFAKSTAKIMVRIPGREHPTPFTLVKFHFHHQSEHRVSGQHWPLEAHVVHQASEPDPWNPGQNRNIFAVLAIMIQRGKGRPETNELFKAITRRFKSVEHGEKDDTPEREQHYDPHALLPFEAHTPFEQVPYWRYEGSLTTEISALNGGYVSWVVLRDATEVDAAILGEWLSLKHEAKAPQDIDHRFVIFSPGRKKASPAGQIA